MQKQYYSIVDIFFCTSGIHDLHARKVNKRYHKNRITGHHTEEGLCVKQKHNTYLCKFHGNLYGMVDCHRCKVMDILSDIFQIPIKSSGIEAKFQPPKVQWRHCFCTN